MTIVRMLLTGVLAAVGLVALTPSASYACSCAITSTKAHVEYADAVFVGTLVSMEPPPRRQVMSSTDPNTYTFSVQQPLKGQVSATTVVESAMSGASCGWEGMEIGQRYIVFANGGHSTWRGNLCGGTRGAGNHGIAQVAEITGTTAQPLPPDLAALLAPIRVVLHSLY